MVQAFVGAEEQLTAAQDARKALEAENQTRLQVLVVENQARVAKADETIRTRKTERAETLAGLAVVVNDDDETAALVNVSPGEVRAARRSVPAKRGPRTSPPKPDDDSPRPTGPASRRRPGRSSQRVATYPLRLAGWEDRSIIGADEQLGGWFAQLRPNGSTSDPPHEWLDAASLNDLTGPIAAATRTTTQDVDTAIANAIAETRRWLASD